MKRVLFLAAGFAALLMTACGGEKTDDKKEEKKEVSEETKTAFDALKTDWSNIDAMISTLSGAIEGYDKLKMNSYLDSMKIEVKESKIKGISEQAMPLVDSLIALNDMSAEWKNTLAGEKETWGMITEDFTKVLTEIEKGEADGEKVAMRVEGFTEQFNYKKETLGNLMADWEAMQRHKAALEALFSEAK
jgi:hypothetical protein